MQKLIRAGLVLSLVAAAVPAWAETPAGSLSALSTQPSMNVFRRFAVDRAKMIEFYGDVLGLKQLPSFQLGGGNEMILFAIGTAQVKLQATPAASQYPGGGVKDATGLRVFTFFYPDEAALTARFTARGYPAPSFTARAAGGRAAMVLDPEKQWVELVVLPGAPADTYRRFEVGITASNLDRSRAFYRSFVGLEELPPIADPVLGATRVPLPPRRHHHQRVVVRAGGAGEQEQRWHSVRHQQRRGSGCESQGRFGDDRSAARPIRHRPAHHLAVGSGRRHQLLRADHAAAAGRGSRHAVTVGRLNPAPRGAPVRMKGRSSDRSAYAGPAGISSSSFDASSWTSVSRDSSSM